MDCDISQSSHISLPKTHHFRSFIKKKETNSYKWYFFFVFLMENGVCFLTLISNRSYKGNSFSRNILSSYTYYIKSDI